MSKTEGCCRPSQQVPQEQLKRSEGREGQGGREGQEGWRRRCFLLLQKKRRFDRFNLFFLMILFALVTWPLQGFVLFTVKGLLSCSLPSPSAEDSENFICDYFQPLPSVNGTTVVTFMNSEWSEDIGQNFYCSLKNVGLSDALLIIAFQKKVCSRFPGVACFTDSSIDVPTGNYGSQHYQKFMRRRIEHVIKLLHCGMNKILLADADVFFIKNPLPKLDSVLVRNDIAFQQDSAVISTSSSSFLKAFDVFWTENLWSICAGFVYMKSNQNVQRLFQAVRQYQRFDWSDQRGLEVCIRHPQSFGLSWTTLNPLAFTTGRGYFDLGYKSDENIVFHGNYLLGLGNKVPEMIREGKWCHEPSIQKWCKGVFATEVDCKRDPQKHFDNTGKHVEKWRWCKGFRTVCRGKRYI